MMMYTWQTSAILIAAHEAIDNDKLSLLIRVKLFDFAVEPKSKNIKVTMPKSGIVFA
jgi:hypothetical protein